ncbi:MAG: single-stranded DNA-binding protein [Candidatus Margulisbacteria bacterium]|jgi:single-strand DNA-binding protein|nr:single-stranded DNA-binding protein [Candidatus Margulisiibacteriota bacterium]
MYNKVFLIGRLTRDPETRYTSAGVAVARFSLAINRPQRRDSTNNEVDFIRVVAWRKLAEICNEYLRKGKLVAIEGRLQISAYEKNGQRLQSAEVIADNMQMLDRKGSDGASGAYPPPQSTGAEPAPVAAGEDAAPF